MLDQMGRILPQQKPPRQQAHCKRPEAIRSTIFAMRQILPASVKLRAVVRGDGGEQIRMAPG